MNSELLYTYLKLVGIAMVPVGITLLLFLLRKLTMFGASGNRFHLLIIGALFGAASVFATEYAVDVGGTFATAADVAPLCAGLFFGGPAGIVAGLIGGAERYLAIAWGADIYLQLAETISIIFAGFFAAFLRGRLFDHNYPAAGVAAATGIVMAIIRMTIVFLTHAAEAGEAFEVVKLCTVPTVVASAVALFVAGIGVGIIEMCFEGRSHHQKTITQRVQGSLIIVVIIAYVVTTLLVYALQTSTADFNAANTIDTNLDDVKSDVIDSADNGLLDTLRAVRDEYVSSPKLTLPELAETHGVDEINLVDADGVVAKSTDEAYVGTNINDREETRAFSSLLGESGAEERIREAKKDASQEDSPKMKYAGIRLAEGGYLEIGIPREAYDEAVTANAVMFTENRHIGNEGYILVANSEGIVVNGKSAGAVLAAVGLGTSETPSYGGVLKQNVAGVPSVYKYVEAEGYLFFGIMTQDEVYSTREASTYVNSFMLVLIFGVIFMMIYFVIRRVVLKDINGIKRDVGSIARGELDVWLTYNSASEFASLSDGINQAIAALKHFNDEEKARIEKDLELAKSIQCSSLPAVFPAQAEYNIYANMRTAKEVGGDFYDFYMVDKNKLVFMIADVSGKGIPAAMFMMTAKTMLKSLTETGITENEVFNRANEKLCENNEAGMFVTAWMGILDTSTGHVKFVNAGHNPPLIYRSGEGFDYIQCKSGFVLSGMETSKYNVQELDLKPGDKILLYTDGVTEATNLYETLYGEERLKKFLNTVADHDVVRTISDVLGDIDRFVGKAPQFDDITMVMVQYNGPIPNMPRD